MKWKNYVISIVNTLIHICMYSYSWFEFFYKPQQNKIKCSYEKWIKLLTPDNILIVLQKFNVPLKTVKISLSELAKDLNKNVSVTNEKYKLKYEWMKSISHVTTAPANKPYIKHLTVGLNFQNQFIGEEYTSKPTLQTKTEINEITQIKNEPMYQGIVKNVKGIQYKTKPILYDNETTVFNSRKRISSADTILEQYEKNKIIYDADSVEDIVFTKREEILIQKKDYILKQKLNNPEESINFIKIENQEQPIKTILQDTQNFNQYTQKASALKDSDICKEISQRMGKNPISYIEIKDNEIIIHYYDYKDCEHIIDITE